jgi:hypothetical protein
MKFLKNLRNATVLAVAALAGLAGIAVAQTVYYGWNPTTGLEVFHGTPIQAGALPVITTNGCSATALVGGAGTFQFTAGATGCSVVFTFPSAAPNGFNCVAQDETTVADKPQQTAHSTTTCTVGGTVAVNDKILVEVTGF